MGWVSQSSYLYSWGNGGGVTQKPDTPAPPPPPEPPVDPDADGDDDGEDS